MPITLSEVTETDKASLVEFLLANAPWPYHGRPTPTAEQLAASWAAGAFVGSGSRTVWIRNDTRTIGICTLSDLGDDIPVFDLRLAADARGHGHGVAALRAVTGWLFDHHRAERFEGTTRVDNIAMRKTFRRAGFVKEAHYRLAWPDSDGVPHDAVGYAMLRGDWDSGTTTPVPFGDEPEI